MGKRSPAEVEIRVSKPPPEKPPPRRGSRDEEFRPFGSWIPWLVPAFVLANAVLFVVTMSVNDCPRNSDTCIGEDVLGRFSFQSLKENPLLGPSASTLVKMGALDVGKAVHEHQGWRLISCIWLHAGVFHILANMISLLMIGIKLEQDFGFVRIGSVYIISGVGGSLLSALFIQSNISVGASGALFGLLGGMLSELITNWTIYANKCVALLTLLFIIGINLALGLLPHVDNFAHIGGFVSGFLLGFIFLMRPQYGWVNQKAMPPEYRTGPTKKRHKTYQYLLLMVAAVLLTFGFVVGLIMLFRGYNANEHCSWCRYLSCLPTSKWSCDNSPSYCQVTTDEFRLNMTCQSNGKSSSYPLPNADDDQISVLCAQLCS